MTANKNYWGGKPHVDELDFKVYKAKDPAVQALIKGEVDYVKDISALQVRALKGKQGITAQDGISPAFEEIGFNTGSVDPKTGKPSATPTPRCSTRSSATPSATRSTATGWSRVPTRAQPCPGRRSSTRPTRAGCGPRPRTRPTPST